MASFAVSSFVLGWEEEKTFCQTGAEEAFVNIWCSGVIFFPGESRQRWPIAE